MQKRNRRSPSNWLLRLALILPVCSLWTCPLRADWISVGAMPPAQSVAGGVEYRNRQGIVRITVVGPGTVRVRFGRGKEFAADDSYAVLPSAIQPSRVPFEFSTSGTIDRLRIALLSVEIHRRPLRLRFLDAEGHLLDKDMDALGMAYDPEGRVRVWKDLAPDSHFFGFGEKTGPLDKRGARNSGSSLVMWNSDTFAYDNTTDPLYAAIPFFITLRNGSAHGTFFDNTWRSNFDIGRQSPASISFGAEGGELNYYVIAGPLPADVLRRYAELTGFIPMPPLWSLGYQQCRYSYYPESRVMELARGFRQRQIPADAIWLDIHYMDGYRLFTWDRERFPRPTEMMQNLADLNLKTVAIVDAGVKEDVGYAAYDNGAKAGVFVRNPDGKLFTGRVWPGASAFPDITDDRGRKWWAGQISDFVSSGLAGVWLDMNEPALMETPGGTMPDNVVFHRNGCAVSQAQIHNVFGQQLSLAAREGLLQLQPESRPFVLTRATYAGGQKYAAAWTGDNVADWLEFRDGLGTLLGMGISGFPFVGSDIGGFADSGPADADLFTRWIQAGTFFPFMRAHTGLESPNKEPWAFGPEHEAYNRHAIERRYRFLPYIYNCFYQTSRTGMPVMSALLLQYPEDAATYNLSDEFLVGSDLLVAPIVVPGSKARQVYLPRGTWYDLRNDANAGSGRKVAVSAGEDELPLFVAEGAILFEAPVIQSSAEWPASDLTFDIFSHGSSEREYYEDDGISFAYRRNGYFLRKVSVRTAAEGATVVLADAEGTFTPQHARNIVRLHFAKTPRKVTLNGQPVAAGAVQFNVDGATLAVSVPQSRQRQTIVIAW